jgi:hypothetical protein
MADIDRVKERTQTDLTDTEIQAIINDATADVAERLGPLPDPANPITVLVEGQRENIVLLRAVDTTQTIVVQEMWDSSVIGMMTVTLDSDDYRIWPPGFRLQRRFDGLQLHPRRLWGDRVQVTYVPIEDIVRRDEVIVKLSVLAIQYDAFTIQTVGDWTGQVSNYETERMRLLRSIGERRGIEML